MSRVSVLSILLLLSLQANALDLNEAVVVTPSALSEPERKAVLMLIDEVETRTHIRWPVTNNWPSSSSPVIALGQKALVPQFAGPYADVGQTATAPEGYRLVVRQGQGSPGVLVIGNDAHGLLFGAGRLLRELAMVRGAVSIDDKLDLTTAPKYALRGHQLGYRPKCNSYDAWDLPTWEQYIRDLAVFGSNAIELIPPRSDDASDSPHFPRPPLEMMTGMSRLADAYGLDVWVWFPALDGDYSKEKIVESALQEWAGIFQKLPRLDAVFVPGGDPGDMPPTVLMPFLEKQTRNLHRFHPKAQMWVSPQGFDQTWLHEFLTLLKTEQPAWLNGLVFGPMVRISLPRLRELVPPQYPIRHYPDITHSRQCQYPVPDWDVAYAVTEARECINPRPEGEAAIFRKLQPNTIGFISYSEGCNDDVNKIIWSALGWDPNMKVADILRQYSRYFIGEHYSEEFAQGLSVLERNWVGSLLTNDSVDRSLAQFQAMENKAPPALLKNWRFQQGLFRAYYDAYTRHRLIFETELEEDALERLRTAPSAGCIETIESAETILATPFTDKGAMQWRTRIFQLGEALFQTIGMQLSVQRYQAIAIDRGACLDTLDYPLNNRPWLEHQFGRIRKMESESERLKALAEVVEWTNPGPGGFYDDLGNVARQPHLVCNFAFADDPGRMSSPRCDFEEDLVNDDPSEKPDGPRRVSWIDHAEALYDAPLQMRYAHLEPGARYKIKVIYGGDSPRSKIRLVANNGLEVHPYIVKPFPFKPVEFLIPQAATKDGDLLLSWYGEEGLGGNGRRCQVSEVWLLKESASTK